MNVTQENGDLAVHRLRFRKANRYVDLTVKFNREGDNITALCEELGTATFGPTFEEADEGITDAIGLHLNALDDQGELEKFCAEHGVDIFQGAVRRWSLVDEGEALAV